MLSDYDNYHLQFFDRMPDVDGETEYTILPEISVRTQILMNMKWDDKFGENFRIQIDMRSAIFTCQLFKSLGQSKLY